MATPDTMRDVEILKDWRIRVDVRLNDHADRLSRTETMIAVRDEDVRWIKGAMKWTIGLLASILLGIIPLVFDFIKWGLTHDWKY
jgi:hypothetical protein